MRTHRWPPCLHVHEANEALNVTPPTPLHLWRTQTARAVALAALPPPGVAIDEMRHDTGTSSAFVVPHCQARFYADATHRVTSISAQVSVVGAAVREWGSDQAESAEFRTATAPASQRLVRVARTRRTAIDRTLFYLM